MYEMIIVSMNIRGGGCSLKRKRIGFMRWDAKVDICFIQETNISSFNTILAEELLGD